MALAQRENDVKLPDGLPGHPLPGAPRGPDDSPVAIFPFHGKPVGYADLVDIRIARGVFFKGPCAIWFRLRHPLLESEEPTRTSALLSPPIRATVDKPMRHALPSDSGPVPVGFCICTRVV